VKSCIDFIQITDLHIDDPPRALKDGRDTTENHLKQVLSNIPFDEVEFVICTGDLVAKPSAAAYKRLVSLLKDVPQPIYCLPGNHDDLPLAIESTQGSNLHWNKTLIQAPWLIIFLDSHEPDTVHGRLGETELAFLEITLQQNPTLHTLICLHHHPVPISSEWLDQHIVRDQQSFFNVIDNYPQVRGIIWGHIHQAFEIQRNGKRLLGTPSTCTQFAPHSTHFTVDTRPPAYRSLSLYPDGKIATELVWCASTN
jgi:Icc protein